MTVRQPFFGPGAAPFLVMLAAALTFKLVVLPLMRTEPDLEFRHLAECSETPPPQGVVYICHSPAMP
jgi:hypothetical protein